MKRSIHLFCLFATLYVAVSIFILSCQKKDSTSKSVSDTEVILFEDHTSNANAKVSRDLFFGGNISKIVKVSYSHSLLNNLKASSDWKTITSEYALDYSDIKLSYLYSAPIHLVTIPVKGVGSRREYFNIYLQDDLILITKLVETRNQSELTNYRVENTDGQLYYQFDLNAQNQLGNWEFERALPKIFKSNTISTGNRSVDDDCAKKPFYECMNCLIIGVCGSDWVCTIACGLAIPSCLGGAAAVCIFV